MRARFAAALVAALFGCGGEGDEGGDPLPLPPPSCAPAASGSSTVAAPRLVYTLADRWHEAWLASPAVADLDGDGTVEIIAPRHQQLLVWHTRADGGGDVVWRAEMPGRIWASPIVADLVPSRAGLEVAVASQDEIGVFDATGQPVPGFPTKWRAELRSLAAGDVDGNGTLELVAVATTPLSANGQRDIVVAIRNDGTLLPGFPPNTSGAAGCDDACYVTGGYDQNIAVGDVDGDGRADLFATQDNAYMSLHAGTGLAFDAAPIFRGRTKFSGIRWMVDYDLAQQGFADDESVDEQAHFTNTAPAIADLDGDGQAELIALGSIQNTAQDDRERGVGLFVMRHDGTRPDAWISPPRFRDYVAGLWDFGDNLVGITNQVTVADIDPSRTGPELIFPGFDGRIHAVDAQAQTLWSRAYTTSAETWTGGVAAGDLSGDGIPELVFTTYGTAGGELIVLDAAGNVLHRTALGGRGAMPVPTIADADTDGDLDIVVSLKDGEDRARQVLVYEVEGSSTNCLLWPTGRGNYRRDGYLPPG